MQLAVNRLQPRLPQGVEPTVAQGSTDDIPVIGDEALAARLADVLPGGSENGAAETQTTQVVVTGLVSVASIASFKRHLGRLTGVETPFTDALFGLARLQARQRGLY